LGMADENVFVLEDGEILETDGETAKKDGKVGAGNVYVDGVIMGDLASVVLRDRRALARDGIVVAIVAVDKENEKLAGKPDIVARGFLEAKGEEEVLEKAREVVRDALDHSGRHLLDAGIVHSKVKDALTKFFYDQTKRRPMIVPVRIEV